MQNKNTKQGKDAFENIAEAQWNKNRERFTFTQNALLELANLFGLTINPNDGTFVAYDADKAKLQFPPVNNHPISDIQQPVIDIDAISTAITAGIMDRLQEHLKANPIIPPKVTASVDDSIHIANNNALLGSFKQLWGATFLKMLDDCKIIREIRDDNSIIYRVDKEGRMQRLVDKEEKARQTLAKKPKLIRLFIMQLNTIKKSIIFYLMAMLIFAMLLWNITLQIDNRDLELSKKEYLILRWHANTNPDSKAFMERLDSFVNAEGISPVYDRVVEHIHDSESK